MYRKAPRPKKRSPPKEGCISTAKWINRISPMSAHTVAAIRSRGGRGRRPRRRPQATLKLGQRLWPKHTQEKAGKTNRSASVRHMLRRKIPVMLRHSARGISPKSTSRPPCPPPPPSNIYSGQGAVWPESFRSVPVWRWWVTPRAAAMGQTISGQRVVGPTIAAGCPAATDADAVAGAAHHCDRARPGERANAVREGGCGGG